MKTNEMSSNMEFPTEIMEDILSRLPVKTLVRFRCVSKSWNLLISDPLFVDMHLNLSKRNTSRLKLIVDSKLRLPELPRVIDHRDFSVDVTYCDAVVISSCNGIVLLLPKRARSIYHTVYLLNPSTKEYKKIISPDIRYACDPVHYGLGYNEQTKDYIIVKIASESVFYNARDDYVVPTKVSVFSLRSNAWKNLSPPFIHQAVDGPINGPNDPDDGSQPGILVNGALHWTSTDVKKFYSTGEGQPYNILAFDIQMEKFSLLSHPCRDKLIKRCVLCELDGNLGLFCSNPDGTCDFWIMRDYGSPESWIKLSTFRENFLNHKLYAKKIDAKVVVYHNGCFHHYNFQDQTLQVFHEIPQLKQLKHDYRRDYQGTFYTESLVPL